MSTKTTEQKLDDANQTIWKLSKQLEISVKLDTRSTAKLTKARRSIAAKDEEIAKLKIQHRQQMAQLKAQHQQQMATVRKQYETKIAVIEQTPLFQQLGAYQKQTFDVMQTTVNMVRNEFNTSMTKQTSFYQHELKKKNVQIQTQQDFIYQLQCENKDVRDKIANIYIHLCDPTLHYNEQKKLRDEFYEYLGIPPSLQRGIVNLSADSSLVFFLLTH